MAKYTETLVLDAKEPNARNVLFRPLHHTLNSEVNGAKLRRSVNNRLYSIGGVLPGDRMTVDFKSLTYSIVHKLNLPENKQLAQQVRKLMATDEISPQNIGRFGNDQKGELDESSVATWLYHIRKLVDCGNLELVSGKLPPFDEIHKMGRVQLSAGTGLPEKLVEKCCFIDQVEDKQLATAK